MHPSGAADFTRDPVPAADKLLSVLVALSFARELGQLTEIVRRAVRRLTRADGVTFVLRQDDQCFYADEDAIRPLWKGRRFPMSECVSGWVMTNRQMVAIPDIYQDPRVPTAAYRPTFVKSLLMAPVRVDDPVAAIGVYWAERHEATSEERSLVQAIANGAALAMENAKLVRDLEEAAERERTARLAAEHANRLTDQFLANMSHELRTPLNVIHGWLWQLRQPGITPDLTRRGLSVVERNAAIQAQLVEDLLDASRAMSGTLNLERERVDLNLLCQRVGGMLAAVAAAQQQSLEVTTAPDPVFVFGDTDRLEQVLRKLVENAIKFTPAGGRIVVWAEHHDGVARFRVRDTGIGLRIDSLGRMFDPFWQLDSSPTRRAGGLGLGLTLVRELVRLHGGRVFAESAGEDAGTTMTVELEPLAEGVEGLRASDTVRRAEAPSRWWADGRMPI